MTNDEIRNSTLGEAEGLGRQNDEARMTKPEWRAASIVFIRTSCFVLNSSFVIRHSSFSHYGNSILLPTLPSHP